MKDEYIILAILGSAALLIFYQKSEKRKSAITHEKLDMAHVYQHI